MGSNCVEVLDDGITIHRLDVPDRTVADYLRKMAGSEVENSVADAIVVGVACLERVKVNRDLEFMRKQIDGLLDGVRSALSTIPASLEREMTKTIGTGDGQLLAPIQSMIKEVAVRTAERLGEVKILLAQDIDPTKETSALGKVFGTIRNLLDPQRVDSIQGCFRTALEAVTAENGSLAKSVAAVVSAAVRPLAEEVNRLSKDLRAAEAAAIVLEHTSAKGLSYEQEVVALLQQWSQVTGAEIHHVGPDNRPGDVLVRIAPLSATDSETRIVVEARDRQAAAGRKVVSDTLGRAIAERNTNAGVYLCRTREGLGRELGDWAEGECNGAPWVATTHEHAVAAVRFLIARRKLAAIHASKTEVDAITVDQQIVRIRTAIGRITTINRKLKDIEGATDAIASEADLLRDEVKAGLFAIEDAIRNSTRGATQAA